MSKPPSTLPSGVRVTDILTVSQFAVIFPIKAILEILEERNLSTIRERHLPNEFVVYFVMMLALFRDCNHREVFRCVAETFCRLRGKRSKDIVIPSSAALSKARDRIKDESLEALFHQCAVPRGKANHKGIWYRQWRKMAIDGSLIDVENTQANREFGFATNQHQTSAGNPQVRFVSLMEVGSHLFIAAKQGGYHDGELALAKALLPHFQPNMICLADRNFYSFDFFKQVTETGAKLLFRVQRGSKFDQLKQFDDNSFLVHIFAATDTKRQYPLRARLIQYKVTGASKETIFLITNILDPVAAPAHELASLYHERWEYEGALDELKTHLNAGSLTLRSKKPTLVKQELWGMLMAHYVVRSTMYDAAELANIDPDGLSFTHTVHVIQRALVRSASDFPPSTDAEESD